MRLSPRAACATACLTAYAAALAPFVFARACFFLRVHSVVASSWSLLALSSAAFRARRAVRLRRRARGPGAAAAAGRAGREAVPRGPPGPGAAAAMTLVITIGWTIAGRGEAKLLRGRDRAGPARRPHAPNCAWGAEAPRPEHQSHHHEYAQWRVIEPVWKSNFYGAFVLNRRVVLHAIDATPARWRAPDALVDFHTE